jgi:alkylmercury lyase
MKTNDLQELAARITAPIRTTAGEAFLEIVPPTLDLLARGKPASPEEMAAASGKSPEQVRAVLERFPSTEWDDQGRVVGLGLTLQLTPHRLELEGRTLFAGIKAVDPPSAVVSIVAARDLANLRRLGCHNTHFFSSQEAASRWLERHPEATILPVDDAFRLGRLIAEGVLDISRPGEPADAGRERTGRVDER